MEKNHKYLTTLLPYLATIYFISLFYFPVSAYDPPYDIALNCGSVGETPANGRNWTGDVEKNFTSQNEPNASVIATALSPSTEPIPYSTARIFHSQFTYSFQVPSGPKFVRLYFFPSLYPEFDATTSFFSVRAGIYTFLSNFSVSLAANHTKSDRIFKEFVINVLEEDNHWLNITFVPSLDGHAFVNGIEVVSLPNFLYYRRSTDIGIPIAGQPLSANFFLENTTALETLYRLNVGGNAISPNQDTGMFRTWSMDDDFLSEFQGIPLFNLTIQVKHSELFPAYLAPDYVYQTARSMGPSKSVNEMNNLSWTLPVHLGFNYLVRLHFCEFYPNISGPQDREFHIYIDRFTVEEQADVINWSGENAAAAYRDYVVRLQRGGSQREYALLVEMHPNPTYRTSYSDVILNGIELFKLSNATWSLAGPNPEEAYVPSLAERPFPSLKRGKKMGDKIVVVSIVCGAAILMALLIVLVLKRRSKPDDRRNGTKTEGTSSLPSNRCRHFSIEDMRRATDNFNEAFILGIGGFGNVYKGYIDDGITPVAIKRLNPGSQQGAREFHSEILMLSKLRHQHLVSLIGYCDEEEEMILVYDYMARGTLRDHLYKTDKPPLPWKQRLEICIGTAHGLHYLHTGTEYSIIHRDVKTTNILLDENWVAKVSDFGLSRVGPTSSSITHVSTAVKGSFGYMDPEYFLRRQLTEKSDVYSFGVVLFEVLCARPPLVQTLGKEQVNLAEWARQCHRNGKLHQIIDQHMAGKIAPECLRKFGELAASCVHDEGIKRPSMNDVVWTLEFALKLQRDAEQGIELGLPHPEHNEETDDKTTVDDLFSDEKSGTCDSTSNGGLSSTCNSSSMAMAGGVFSEIMNPMAR